MKRTLLLLFSFITIASFSQSNFTNGLLPKVNVSKKINDKFKWVNSLETRQVTYKDNFQFTHSLVDVSSIISFKTDVNTSLNIGYIIRFKEGEIIHRLLQHYNIVQNIEGLKLAHRFAFEQFYQPKLKPQYRSRYRATIQKPLNGEKVDIKEWYIKLSNEYLYQFNHEDLEVRLSPYLGYQLTKKDKLEFGLDYRLGSLLDSPNKNSLWVRATWYISL